MWLIRKIRTGILKKYFEGVNWTNRAENWNSLWTAMNNGMAVWLCTVCRISRIDEELIDILSLSFRRVLYAVCVLLGISPASEV